MGVPTLYGTLYNFSKTANAALYMGAKTAIFCNPDKMKYEAHGITKIREYNGGKAGNYSKSQGWAGSGAKTGGSLQWVEYAAPFDRANVITVDAQDELNSFDSEMTPSIELMNEDFLNNGLAAEVDAANIARFFSKVPSANKLTTDDLGIGKGNILDTLADIEAKVFNSGYAGDIVLFMASDVYANMQKAIADKSGLANQAIVTKTITVTVDNGLADYVEDEEANTGALEITLEVKAYGKFIIMEMPTDRMYSAITMLDGQSEGQEAGGYIAADGAKGIKLLAMPLPAAFTSVRYIVDNYLVPYAVQAENPDVTLLKDNQRMFGNVEINNAGINQKANAWEFDTRIVYGGDIFSNRAKNCFALTEA